MLAVNVTFLRIRRFMLKDESRLGKQLWREILGKQIWSIDRRLTSDGVVTYAERGYGGICPNMEAE